MIINPNEESGFTAAISVQSRCQADDGGACRPCDAVAGLFGPGVNILDRLERRKDWGFVCQIRRTFHPSDLVAA
jgi:hypothetical protein